MTDNKENNDEVHAEETQSYISEWIKGMFTYKVHHIHQTIRATNL